MSRLMRASVVVPFLLLTSSLAAQYVERVDVSIASVDVVVRDKAGHLVRGLTKADFEVYEDGELQTITNFSAVDVSAPRDEHSTAGESSIAASIHTPRLLVLFFDIRDIDPASRQVFFQGVRTFADTSMREGDFATILTWNNRVRVILPPTADRARIDTVIDELGNQRFAPLWETLQRVNESLAAQEVEAAEFARSVRMQPASDPAADAAFEEYARTEDICMKTRRKLRELKTLLTHLTKIEMKKVLLFASDDASLRPSRDCGTTTQFEALANTANAYGITIHGLHPPGPRTKVIGPEKGLFLPSTRSPTPMAAEYVRAYDEAGGLSLLASTTGGVAGLGRMSGDALKRAAEELDVYYSLGYAMSPGKEDKSRKVRVVTKNGKYRVRTRDSVVRLSEAARLQDQITTNLYFPEETDPLSPAFTALVVRTEPDRRLLRLTVEVSIRSSDLMLQTTGVSEKKKGSFSVFVAAGRELGDASEVTELKQDFDASSVAVPTLLVYSFETRVRPDTRRLSLAVRDNTTGETSTSILPLKP